MTALIIGLILALTATGLAWSMPKTRRTIWVGSVFGLPFGLIQVYLAGFVRRLGVDQTDAILAFIGSILIGSATLALVAVLYDALIRHRIVGRPHVRRGHLAWLAAGPGLSLVLMNSGQPGLMSVLVGLFLNALILILVGRRGLVWDAIVASDGLALLYVSLQLMFGARPAGDIIASLTDGTAFGITISGRPVEELVFLGLVGVLLGPLYAATASWRRCLKKPVRATTKHGAVAVGLISILIMVGVTTWVAAAYALPPRVVAISPNLSEMGVPTATALTVRFSHPIDRDQLELEIIPDADGSWIFDQPSNRGHGYRRARFEFTSTLLPATTYRGRIQGIRSPFGSVGGDRSFRFTTRRIPDVEGITGASDSPGSVSENGSVMLADPCVPINVQLSSEYDQSAEFAFDFEPKIPATVVFQPGAKAFRITSENCLDRATGYRLSVNRRIIQRDSKTSEVIMAGDWMTVAETTLHRGAVGESRVESEPSVLGIEALSGSAQLKPTRAQKVLRVKMDYQDWPLSCEAAALKMALGAQGVRVSEKSIMRKIGYDPTPRRRGVWGDPDRAFVGNIAGKQNTSGYGVHWLPIARAGSAWRPTRVIRNATVERLAQEIQSGRPVVVWGTLGRARRDAWRTPKGKVVRAWKGEHARTVIGFYGSSESPTHFVLNDPVAGRLVWTRETLERNWTTFGRTGVIVL